MFNIKKTKKITKKEQRERTEKEKERTGEKEKKRQKEKKNAIAKNNLARSPSLMTSAPKSLKFGTPFPPLSRNIKYWSKDNPLLDGLN